MAKKNLLLHLFTSELVFDIRNKTYLTGKSRIGKDASEIANMQASEDEEVMDQLARSVQNAYSSMLNKLSDYVIQDAQFTKTILSSHQPATMTDVVTTRFGTGDNILLWDSNTSAFTPAELFIVLAMPSNYNEASEQTVAYAVHQYIVNRAVAEWFAITNKEDASDYLKLSETNIAEIHEALNKRVRPERSTVTNEYI